MKPLFLWNTFKSWTLGIPVRMKIMGMAFGLLAAMGVGILIQVRLGLLTLTDTAMADTVRLPMILTDDQARVEESLAFIREQGLQMITEDLAFVILIIALGGIAIAYVLTDLITTPIQELVEVTETVGRGDFQRKARVRTQDEIGQLGSAFNAMIDNLDYTQMELKRKEDMRSHLLRKVISAQEEERQRIARELHDQIGQMMTSILVGLKVIESMEVSKDTGERIAELRSYVGQAFETVHDLALDLRPSVLDDLGLPAAIQRYIDEFIKKFNVDVDYQILGFDDAERLPIEVETALYRIIQEILINIARHANADNAGVLLQMSETKVLAFIEDDGVGFDVDSVMESQGRRQLGLFGMHERTALLGGKLTIESTVGTGTTVRADIPIEKGLADEYYQDSACG